MLLLVATLFPNETTRKTKGDALSISFFISISLSITCSHTMSE